jgi:hypothetical protein
VKIANITAQQKKDMRAGLPVTLTLQGGGQIVVTPYMLAWAKQVIASGGTVTILPEIVGTGKMDDVQITV